jgi:hypothetical protein
MKIAFSLHSAGRAICLGIAGLFMWSVSSGTVRADVEAGLKKGHEAIQAELPSGSTVENASHQNLLTALERAAAKSEDLAPEIGAAAVRARFGGSAEPQTAEAFSQIAQAIINGVTPPGQAPNPQVVASILQAMMWALPSDKAHIGAQGVEGVFGALPPEIVVAVQRNLSVGGAFTSGLPDQQFHFSAPPGAVVDPPVAPDQAEEDEEEQTSRPPRGPVPVPTPQVTPFTES